MTPRATLALGACVALAAGLLHCGSSSDSGGSAPGGGFGGSGGAPTSDAGPGGGFGGAAGASAPPPEKEVESSFRAPVATGHFIWAANPDSGRVAIVNALSLDVTTVEAGFGPTWLAAVPGQNAAIVLNVSSHDATLLRVADDSSISTKTLPTHSGANAWSMGAAGHWAVAWTDARLVANPDPTDGFQDVTVMHLDAGHESATRLSVGYRPTSVVIDQAETRVFVVTDPGVSVIALDGAAPVVTDLVQVTADPVDNPASRDVNITPDGSIALVRLDGSADVGVVSLSSGERRNVTLPGPVTDLDLSGDGTRAVAVVRDTSQVAVLPVPAILDNPLAFDLATIDGETFGSVSLPPDASLALLYTNAIASDHVTILNTATTDYLSHRTVSVKTPVQAVFPTPDAENAIAFQLPGASSSKAGAFSIIPTKVVRAPKIIGTDAPPTAIAIAPAPSDRALVTERDDAKKIYGAYLVRMPTLQVDRIPLASPPMAVGIVPDAGKGYVAQEHPDGRITFINLSDGSARTLTGFELGAKIVN